MHGHTAARWSRAVSNLWTLPGRVTIYPGLPETSLVYDCCLSVIIKCFFSLSLKRVLVRLIKIVIAPLTGPDRRVQRVWNCAVSEKCSVSFPP